ncbi:hypothetical protein CFR75_11470 [Komagataeibacter xylinus]|uniref:Uncharacterized protein n=1 Tax=Komagataeibacter xylinus TaxID=28448 RepID=A0A318PJP2_KOMXY|nr:hypothetical protein CFR75_11470 [Komagataeibacter xylinus]
MATGAACALSPAHATERGDQASACKGDVFRLCFLDIPNEKLMTECLESKLDQLSPRCRAMFEDDGQPEPTGTPAQPVPPAAPAPR